MENDEFDKTYRYALYLLGQRDYPKRKLIQKFRLKGVSREISDQVLARLEELGYLREDEYFRGRVRYYLRKGHSFAGVLECLRQEGAPRALELLQEIWDEESLSDEAQKEKLKGRKRALFESLEDEELDREELWKRKQKTFRLFYQHGHHQ